jgi:hypothetical protein
MRIVTQVQPLQQMAQQMKFMVAIEENSKLFRKEDTCSCGVMAWL